MTGSFYAGLSAYFYAGRLLFFTVNLLKRKRILLIGRQFGIFKRLFFIILRKWKIDL